MEGTFDGLKLTHVLRNDNNKADELAKMGSRRAPVPTGERLKYVLQIYFSASNNAAKYEALLHRLCIAISLRI